MYFYPKFLNMKLLFVSVCNHAKSLKVIILLTIKDNVLCKGGAFCI